MPINLAVLEGVWMGFRYKKRYLENM